MTEATVSAAFVKARFWSSRRQRGAARHDLLAGARLEPRRLRRRRRPHTVRAVVGPLMRAAKKSPADRALALGVRRSSPKCRTFSVVGLISHAVSEHDRRAYAAQRAMGGWSLTFAARRRTRFRSNGVTSGLWYIDHRADPNDFLELTESGHAHHHSRRGSRSMPDWAREAHVTHPAPAYRDEIRRSFRAPVKFDQPWNASRREAIVSHKLDRMPRYVFGVLTERADAMMEALEAGRHGAQPSRAPDHARPAQRRRQHRNHRRQARRHAAKRSSAT